MMKKSQALKIALKISIFLVFTIVLFGFWPFTTNAALSIATTPASNVRHSSAMLNGTLNEGSLSITGWFELGTNPNSLNMSTNPTYYNSLSSNYNALVSGLYNNTTYYFRAVAENFQGRIYGNILSFTTGYNPYYDTNNLNYESIYGTQPAITTNSATSISGNSAVLNGFVNGSNLATTAWFEWGINVSFTNSTAQNSYGYGVSAYNTTLTGLTPNTIYHFRAVAQNAKGRVFGNTVSFTTGSISYLNYPNQPISSELKASTNSAISISATSAKLSALIVNSGIIPSITWFEWGPTINLGEKTEIISTGNYPAVKHINTLSGLTPKTTYYFRAVAENNFSRSISETTYFITDTAESSKSAKSNDVLTENNEIKNSPTITPVELGASVFSAGFLPGNIFGWLLLIVLILFLILLTQRLFSSREARNGRLEHF